MKSIRLRSLVVYVMFCAVATVRADDLGADNTDEPIAPQQELHPTFTSHDRLRWLVSTTIGPKNLAAGTVVAGFETWRDKPEAWGPHWDGFGIRYGARLAAGGTSHALEAGFGSLWGEDPRYYRASGRPLGVRLGHVLKMAFVTHNSAGTEQPAYARYLAIPGGVLVTNTWEPDSPNTLRRVSYQVGLGFLSRIAGNAFSEFFPDIKDHRKRASTVEPRENH